MAGAGCFKDARCGDKSRGANARGQIAKSNSGRQDGLADRWLRGRCFYRGEARRCLRYLKAAVKMNDAAQIAPR